MQLVQGHIALGVGSHGLEHILNIYIAALEPAGHHGAAVNEDGRNVETGNGHHAAGHILVAAAHGDQTIHALAEGHHLNGVGDNFPADQGCLHALGAHGYAVADGNGAELEGGAAGLPDTLFDGVGEPVQVDVAGGHVAGQVGDGDEGLVQVILGQSHGPQHGPGWSALRPFGDIAAAVLHLLLYFSAVGAGGTGGSQGGLLIFACVSVKADLLGHDL